MAKLGLVGHHKQDPMGRFICIECLFRSTAPTTSENILFTAQRATYDELITTTTPIGLMPGSGYPDDGVVGDEI